MGLTLNDDLAVMGAQVPSRSHFEGWNRRGNNSATNGPTIHYIVAMLGDIETRNMLQPLNMETQQPH